MQRGARLVGRARRQPRRRDRRPVPGHRVAIIDGGGRVLPAGEVGEIAVARPDPVMFLEYWQSPEATEESSSATG